MPPAGRELLAEFSSVLASWKWDVALLQEVPPWWPGPLARATGADERHVLTSRNGVGVGRRAVATRWPDLIKSNAGGCNAILVRGGGPVTEHRSQRLCRLPERRWVHAVRLAGGAWIGNLHASGPDADARRDGARAGAALLRWANGSPALLGGDFNVAAPLVPDFALTGGRDVDHFAVAGLRVTKRLLFPDRGRLSDHAPVIVAVTSRG